MDVKKMYDSYGQRMQRELRNRRWPCNKSLQHIVTESSTYCPWCHFPMVALTSYMKSLHQPYLIPCKYDSGSAPHGLEIQVGTAGTDILLATNLRACTAEAPWGWGSSKMHAMKKNFGKGYLFAPY